MKFSCIKMSEYFPKSYEAFGGDIIVTVDLSNYARKARNATGIDAYKLAAKFDLASSKGEIDKLDIDKLVPVPFDLSKISNVVKNDVIKKTVYDILVAKVNSTDTSRFALKSMMQINQIYKRKFLILVVDYNAKTTETENKIPSISGLATASALTALENKIPNISSLVKTTDDNTKISEIEKKLIMINILLFQNLII